MLVSFKAASVGLSSVACVAVILAFVKYARTRPVFEGVYKFLNQLWLHITHEVKVKRIVAPENSVSEPSSRKENMTCAFNDIKAIRKALYPYVLAASSAIIIMSVCGKVAKSPSFVLQMSSVVGAFMAFGAALMTIGLFAYKTNDKEEDASNTKNGFESVVSTLSLTVMGFVVVSYVVNCGLSA